MNTAPSGTVTFLFTDIVGSTEMWERHGDAFLPVLQAHNAIIGEAVQRFGGYVVKTEGDSYKVAFDDPCDAVRCALVAQAALQRYPWPDDVGEVRVRMAVHTGRPFKQAGDYFGPPLNRTARLLSAAHGGQVLLSEDTLNLVEHRIEADTRFADLGYHRLKDLDEPVRIFHAQHPAIGSTSFPPPRTLNGHANNLPVQRTSFIGREKEIEQIAAFLARDDVSLLALTGPKGIGKTRLSLQVAAERVELFPDGVWFVRLSGAVDARAAAVEVATAMGIPLTAGTSPVETVRAWLADRRCLLILDDCGHVPEAGRFICELLSDSASLRCLATSRESLRLEQGRELEVPELTRPAPDADAAGLLASEAGRLFVDRAQAERADFELNDRRARPISRLLSRWPGLPEVVERAAAMLRQPDPSPAQTLTALGRELKASVEDVGQFASAQGREIVSRLREAPGLAALMESLGVTPFDRSRLDEAERESREALVAHERAGDKHGVGVCLRTLGNIAYARGDYSRAVSLLSAARQAFEDLGDVESGLLADLELARHALAELTPTETSDPTQPVFDRGD